MNLSQMMSFGKFLLHAGWERSSKAYTGIK